MELIFHAFLSPSTGKMKPCFISRLFPLWARCCVVLCISFMTVNAQTPCILTCPPNMEVNATSLSGAVVNYSSTGSSGICGSLTYVPASGSLFPVGTTPVYSYENYDPLVYAITLANQLVSFNPATPGTVSAPVAITGLGADEQVQSIDFRIATGELYGLVVYAAGTQGRLYKINKTTGAATAVGISGFALPIGGVFAIDFDPVADRVRLTSSAGLNLRLDPNLGTVVSTDVVINAVGQIVATAYSNNYPGSATTTLYGIDATENRLYIHNPPNDGVLTLVGPLGVDPGGTTGFDIAPNGTAYALMIGKFYTLNLATGTANLVGTLGNANLGDIALPVGAVCSFNVTVNATNLPPAVTINKAAAQADPTTVEPVHFTVVFDQDVTGFDATDISFTGSTVGGTLQAVVTGSGTTYDVAVSGITSTGSVVASVIAGAATNSSDQASLASTSTDNTVGFLVIPHDLIVIKQSSAPTVLAGGILVYPITIINNGSAVTQSVTLTDVLPAEVVFVNVQFFSGSGILAAPFITTPAPGQNGMVTIFFPALAPAAQITYIITVGVGANATGTISNTATLSGPPGDVNAANNSSTAITQIAIPPTITCPANITVSTRETDCLGIVDLGSLGFTLTGNPAPTLRISFRQQDNPLVIPVDVEVTPGTPNPVGFEKGTTTVTATASNGVAPNATCQFTITVNDATDPVITCPAPVAVNADPGVCTATISNTAIGSATAVDNCPGTITVTHSDFPAGNKFPIGTTTIIWTATDASGRSSTCEQTVTVSDNAPPVISGVSANPAMLAPPNHKMKDVTISYSVDDCSAVTNVLTVSDNEDNDPADYQVIDAHHLKLRAERKGTGEGRIYTVTITSTDAAGNRSTASTTVVVAHNVTSPHSGAAFRVGSTVNIEGTFWDVAGNRHTASWLIDDKTSVKGIVTEPSGMKNGTVTGSYKFTTPGVYKLQMNVTDQKGVTTYANTNGELEAIVVIYDPNGGYTYGGGWFHSPAGALKASPAITGSVSYGFAVNYFKTAILPRGETQFEFKLGEFEFNAVNFDYLSISGAKAQFKGSGKIIGGQSGINFIMTVIDGSLDGTGIDKVRIKIYNKKTGKIYYDNQPGASDRDSPITAVGNNSEIVIQNINNTSIASARLSTGNEDLSGVDKTLEVTAMPNPSRKNFNLIVRSNYLNDKIIMQVTDILGRTIEVRNVTKGQTIVFGDKYRPGIYVITLIQGNMQRQLKLVKLSE